MFLFVYGLRPLKFNLTNQDSRGGKLCCPEKAGPERISDAKIIRENNEKLCRPVPIVVRIA